MSRRAAFAAGVCLLGILACNEETPPPQQPRFNRPNRVDFVCVDGTQVVAREACRRQNAGRTLHMHALVTQTGRGEIAVVDLYDGDVIDSRRDIPGYTFVPVGESPRAIIAPPNNADHTYVANFGSRDVRVLRTRALVATVAEKPDAQRVLLRDPDSESLLAPIDMVLAPDEDALFVAVADAADPKEDGAVLRLPIVRCDASSGPECVDGLIDEAGITKLSVTEETLPAPVAGTPSVYEELCEFPYSRREQPSATPVAVSDADLERPARPSALAVDAFCRKGPGCTRRLLVADSAQPFIHVIDIDAWATAGSGRLSTPIATGVPTKDVVVTPRVPREVGGQDETQYVYAIDANDGSVLAVENGQLLSVYGLPADEPTVPGQRTDRLRFTDGQNGALALEVVTPEYDPYAPADQYVRGQTREPIDDVDPKACTDQDFREQIPARLRGVFLTVARADGTVHVFDVHDMELRPSAGQVPCRECAPLPDAAADDETTGGGIPVLKRNHERLATTFVSTESQAVPSFVPDVAMRFAVDNVAFTVRDNGTTTSPRAPGLACLSCDAEFVRAFPGDEREVEDVDEDQPPNSGAPDGGAPDGGASQSAGPNNCPEETPALLCVGPDPWSSGEDEWFATYEGLLPESSSSRGSFVPSAQMIDDLRLRLTTGGTIADKVENFTGGLELTSDRNPCSAGVLGAEDMADDYGGCGVPRVDEVTGGPCDDEMPERCVDNPTGDQVVITSRPLDRQALERRGIKDEKVLERCALLATELAADPEERVAFEIRRAYRDRLVLRSALARSIGTIDRFEHIYYCYEPVMSFEVRSYQAFTVLGRIAGMQHRVIESGSVGRCQVDELGDRLRASRARLGCPYRNHSVQFQLRQSEQDRAQLAGVGLNFSFTSSARKVVFSAFNLGFGSATVVTEQLRFNPTDQRLYLVDINARGLLPIPLDPFPSALSSAGQFN